MHGHKQTAIERGRERVSKREQRERVKEGKQNINYRDTMYSYDFLFTSHCCAGE